MRSTGLLLLALLLSSGAVSGQSMMSSGSPSSGTGSMTSSATADPKIGAELRKAPSTGRKVIFTTLAAAQALAAKGPVVLFFASDWGAASQKDLRDINANGLTMKDVTVVVVDYDRDAAVRRQFGVAGEDTFLLIDRSGKKLGVWTGGGVAQIIKHALKV